MKHLGMGFNWWILELTITQLLIIANRWKDSDQSVPVALGSLMVDFVLRILKSKDCHVDLFQSLYLVFPENSQ